MGVRSDSGVRSEMRRGKRHWVIDFSYIDKNGTERRYRRDAKVQAAAMATAVTAVPM